MGNMRKMNTYTKKVEKSLDLSLTVTDTALIVDSYQPDCGDDYRLTFSREQADDEVALRIGHEVLSWLRDMEDEWDDLDDEE